MSEQQSNIDSKVSSDLPIKNSDENKVDLMEILCKIILIRKTLYKAAAFGLILGIVVALSIPQKYTVNVTLSPEMSNSKGNNGLAGIAASFLGSSAAVGESLGALNASLSADIVSSTPFLLELLKMNVLVSERDAMTLESYLDKQSSPWWNYIIGLPSMAIGGIKTFFEDDKDDIIYNREQISAIELTKKESSKINLLKKSIVTIIDKKTGITNVSVTLQDPKVTAIVADSVVCKLQKHIIDYRTTKAKEDCKYLEKLFKERQLEYYDAQQKYANYVDTHDNLIRLSVRAEQERLQNDMNLAYQVYSQVANQLQIARAKVQEESPVFAIVEPAVIPLYSSGMGMKIYVILFIFITVICTIVWLLLGKELLNIIKKEIK